MSGSKEEEEEEEEEEEDEDEEDDDDDLCRSDCVNIGLLPLGCLECD